jgi:hypothetical protein
MCMSTFRDFSDMRFVLSGTTNNRSTTVQAAYLASGLYQLVQQHSKHHLSVTAIEHLPRCDGYGNWYSDNSHSPL